MRIEPIAFRLCVSDLTNYTLAGFFWDITDWATVATTRSTELESTPHHNHRNSVEYDKLNDDLFKDHTISSNNKDYPIYCHLSHCLKIVLVKLTS